VTVDEAARQRFEAAFNSYNHKDFLPDYLGVREGELSFLVNGREIEIVNDEVRQKCGESMLAQ
jgi:hypothetical protein